MRRRNDTEPDAAAEGPSKTQIKKAMHELQDLGAELLELPEAQLETIDMEEQLRDALREIRHIRSFEARRRQEKYIGKLLRQTDPEPFREAIAAHRLARTRDAMALKEVERWRERLLADDEGVAAWFAAYPAGDTPQLRALIRNARRELAASKPADPSSHAGGSKGRFYRELFQKLRTVMQASATADRNQAPDGEN